MTGGALRRASNHSKFAVAAPTGLVKCYSVRISEDTNTRVVPTALEGVLSLEEYQRVVVQAAQEYERTRSRGTRLLRVATHFPCIVLCLVSLLLRQMERLDAQLHARLQAVCDAASAEQGNGVRFSVRQLGGVCASGSKQLQHQLWIDVHFSDPGRRVAGNLYELQPPSRPNELPPCPHSPPDFGGDTSDEDGADGCRDARRMDNDRAVLIL